MRINKKYRKLFSNIKRFFYKFSNIQIIFFVYLFVTFLFALLLKLPISQKPGVNVNLIDALFTAASAFSDTGLTTKVTIETWSDFGQFLIIILILIGGIGIFALKVFVVNIIFKKSISITSRNILEKERGASNTGDLKRTIKTSIIFLFVAIAISTFILWLMFYFEKGNFSWTVYNLDGSSEIKDFTQYNPQGDVLLSFKCAIFHSISAINNAGFDILSDSSLYPYYGVYSIQIVFIILLIIGGIGYPVIYETIQYISYKARKRTDFKFSLFTKVSSVTYISVFVIGLALTLMFEIGSKNVHANMLTIEGIWNNERSGSVGDRAMTIIFHVFSTRSAGFTTLDPNVIKFTSPTLVVFSIMMFIGAAPSSTGGGIRTTTLAIVVVAIWNRFRGIQGVRMFKRKISDDIIYSSFIVLAISIFIVFFSTLVCFTSLNTLWGEGNSDNLGFADVFFDVSSAFGTTGLTTGLSSSLNIISKLVLILTMFIGQLGISSTMLVWRKNNRKNNYTYIEENIIIG
ncbi:MAG: hypothetical protein HDR43_03200 [Mycoplasma sp.]|nr:hypothetical protein [Mycoplasma sp.]